MNTKDPAHIRILHTADWHLGREFHKADLTDSHLAFFEWLTAQITVLEIDVLIMAGDIYDRAYPPTGAVEQFNHWIDRLAELVPVVLISGNHDSVVRMGFGSLLRDNIHLASGSKSIGEPVTLDIRGRPIHIYPIPYLEPVQAMADLGTEEKSHEAVLSAALDLCREDLKSAAEEAASVAVAHAFVTGARTAESERDIAVGGAGDVPAGIFDGFDYVALGHLHRPQTIGERVRYSGSPLFLSFSEAQPGDVENIKSVSVAELNPSHEVSIEEIPVPGLRPVSRIEGEFKDLLTNAKWGHLKSHWLEITLTDDHRPEAPMESLRHEFPHLLNLKYAKDSAIRPAGSVYVKQGKDVSDFDLSLSFVSHVRPERPADDQETELLKEAIESMLSPDEEGRVR